MKSFPDVREYNNNKNFAGVHRGNKTSTLGGRGETVKGQMKRVDEAKLIKNCQKGREFKNA